MLKFHLGKYGPLWYNVKIPFGEIWSTMVSQLKLITCVYIVLFIGNICKLMPITALLISLNVISDMRFYLNEK